MSNDRIEKLLEVMAQLRDPAGGCPWDLEQTFATIAPYTVEEAYEVADAIERDDLDALRGELGDLLFQVVFHARMAEERGAFTFGDVVQGIVEKMLRRHPHVFAPQPGQEVRDAGEVVQAWEAHKAAERRARRQTSLLEDVPRALPALTRAAKLTRRAAAAGFDWPHLGLVLDKLQEELAEFRTELGEAADEWATAAAPGTAPGDVPAPRRERLADELGDVLFVVANLARHLRIDPEAALQGANAKFVRRFGYIEGVLAERGQRPEDVSLEVMDGLWNEAKARLG